MIYITNFEQIAEFTNLHSWRVEDQYLQEWLVKAVQRYVLETRISLNPARNKSFSNMWIIKFKRKQIAF